MEKGLDHIGVTIVFFCHDGKGNFLLGKRGNNARDEHGRWDVGSGALEFDEKVEDALRREIREEYCTDVLSYDFLGFRDVHRELNGRKTHWIALVFKALVDPSKVRNGEPDKLDEIGWFKLGHFPKPLHSQGEDFLKIFSEKLK